MRKMVVLILMFILSENALELWVAYCFPSYLKELFLSWKKM